ncbi:hypothetical protein [Demequina rhizosphaerae]|uniref:hypothetical protein n=1 Tax=Demequina rhizosphaerae TaxID=1638985 RepID=UPI000783697B|nr:hypothetical protein [Demequina rhizosphaerae]
MTTPVRIHGVGGKQHGLLAFVGPSETRVRMHRVLVPHERWRCDDCGEPEVPCVHAQAVMASPDFRTLKTEGIL